MAYNASTLKQSAIWCTTPDGYMGGNWMSGRAPAVDSSGNAYYMVGNGDWNGTRNFGESLLKFSSASGMSLVGWFTPDSWSAWNGGDVDFGSSGTYVSSGHGFDHRRWKERRSLHDPHCKSRS